MLGSQSFRPAEDEMHPEDLMNSDMPSVILLLVTGSLIFITLSVILVAVLTQTLR